MRQKKKWRIRRRDWEGGNATVGGNKKKKVATNQKRGRKNTDHPQKGGTISSAAPPIKVKKRNVTCMYWGAHKPGREIGQEVDLKKKRRKKGPNDSVCNE